MRDLLAGLSIAGIMLPEAVAYAGIAGLPPQRAILAAIAGGGVYWILGRSRFAIVSATSSSAAILAASLATLGGTVAERMTLATLAVLMVGVLFGLASLLRLGGVASFVSRPALRGFAFGLAVTIIIKQLPTLVGVHAAGPSIFAVLAGLLRDVGQWHVVSVAVGLSALALILLFRRMPRLPGAFLVLGIGIAASAMFDLTRYGVVTVGVIDLTPHWQALALPTFQQFSAVAQLAIPLVLILFAESWGTIRTLALKHNDTVDPDRELGALGLSNIAAALVQGMPVGAGFSAGSMAEGAGSQSRLTGVVAAVTLALLVVFAMPLIALLPQPVLSAVVIAALLHALNPAPIMAIRYSPRDLAVALTAVAGVLLFGVLNGMLIAIALSVVLMIQRMSSPLVAVLGRLPNSHDFVDVARHPEAAARPDMMVLRPAEPLFFGNAERILAAVGRQVAGQGGVQDVVVSLENTFDLDSTAVEALREFDAAMDRGGYRVCYARVRDHVRDRLIAAGATDIVNRSRYSVDDAVTTLQRSEEDVQPHH